MKTRFTRHAIERLQERNVSVEKIEETVTAPDFKTEENGIYTLYKIYRQLALKVVCRYENESVVIITVYWVEKERLKGIQPIIEGES